MLLLLLSVYTSSNRIMLMQILSVPISWISQKLMTVFDWGLLERALLKRGFSATWVSWIMECVTTVKYSVKFNGKLLRQFSPSRGLRQGDPLSPFLFLFVADALSSLLRKAVSDNIIEPVKICRRVPGISHLLFED